MPSSKKSKKGKKSKKRKKPGLVHKALVTVDKELRRVVKGLMGF